MKTWLTSFGVLAALTATASAADLPRRAAPPVFTPVPVFTWTGFYAGFNAGYAFNAQDDSGSTVVAYGDNTGVFNLPNAAAIGVPANFTTGGVAAFSNRGATDGFTGGGQIGYNYQFTPGTGIVIGIEADAQYLDFGRNRDQATFFTTFTGVPTTDVLGTPAGLGAVAPGARLVNPNGLSSLDFFGTVRGRIGYAFDRVLFYGTGGFAYASGEDQIRYAGSRNGDDFRTGYAVGGGIEYAVPTNSFLNVLNFFGSNAVTFKVEGLYVNLDRNRGDSIVAIDTTGTAILASDPRVQVVGLTNRRNDEFAVIRAGVNYKFGSY